MEALILAFTVATTTFSLPNGLLPALCFVESSHRTKVVHVDDGKENSLGVCQVQLSTARTLGFRGTATQLMDPKMNVKYAAKYLAKQLKRYSGNVPKAIAAYNSGTYRLNKKGLPINHKYVIKVLEEWSKGL